MEILGFANLHIETMETFYLFYLTNKVCGLRARRDEWKYFLIKYIAFLKDLWYIVLCNNIEV